MRRYAIYRRRVPVLLQLNFQIEIVSFLNEKKEKKYENMGGIVLLQSIYPACLFLMCHAPERASIKRHRRFLKLWSLQVFPSATANHIVYTVYRIHVDVKTRVIVVNLPLIEIIDRMNQQHWYTDSLLCALYAPAAIVPRVLDNDTCPNKYKCTFCMIRHTTMHERCIEGRT